MPGYAAVLMTSSATNLDKFMSRTSVTCDFWKDNRAPMQRRKKDESESASKTKTKHAIMNLLHEFVSASAPATFPCQRSWRKPTSTVQTA